MTDSVWDPGLFLIGARVTSEIRVCVRAGDRLPFKLLLLPTCSTILKAQ